MKIENRTGMAGAVAAVLTLALAAGPVLGAAQKYEEKFARTEALAGTGMFYLSNVSGDIEIAVWKEAQVKIEAVKTSKGPSLDTAKKNADKVTIEVTKEGDAVRVETKYPKRNGGFWGGDRLNVSVSYKVWVPDRAAVEVRSVSGDVVTAALGGKVRIDGVSGNVALGGAAGTEIKLVSGDIKAKNIAGEAFLKTVSGGIEVTGVKGSVVAEAVSGDVGLLDVAGARRVEVKTVSGDVVYTGGIEAGGRYGLQSLSGDIRMTLPGGAGFDFEANTFSGTIDAAFDITVSGKISPREIRGTVGKGGAFVMLKSFSGDIALKKK